VAWQSCALPYRTPLHGRKMTRSGVTSATPPVQQTTPANSGCCCHSTIAAKWIPTSSFLHISSLLFGLAVIRSVSNRCLRSPSLVSFLHVWVIYRRSYRPSPALDPHLKHHASPHHISIIIDNPNGEVKLCGQLKAK
jgi:hypothetical protein